MKKILSLILSVIMIFGLVGCGNKDKDTTTKPDDTQKVETSQTENNNSNEVNTEKEEDTDKNAGEEKDISTIETEFVQESIKKIESKSIDFNNMSSVDLDFVAKLYNAAIHAYSDPTQLKNNAMFTREVWSTSNDMHLGYTKGIYHLGMEYLSEHSSGAQVLLQGKDNAINSIIIKQEINPNKINQEDRNTLEEVHNAVLKLFMGKENFDNIVNSGKEDFKGDITNNGITWSVDINIPNNYFYMQRKDVADIRIDTDSAVTLVNEKKNEVLSLLDSSMLGEAYLKYDGLTTEAGARKALEDAGLTTKNMFNSTNVVRKTYVGDSANYSIETTWDSREMVDGEEFEPTTNSIIQFTVLPNGDITDLGISQIVKEKVSPHKDFGDKILDLVTTASSHTQKIASGMGMSLTAEDISVLDSCKNQAEVKTSYFGTLKGKINADSYANGNAIAKEEDDNMIGYDVSTKRFTSYFQIILEGDMYNEDTPITRYTEDIIAHINK